MLYTTPLSHVTGRGVSDHVRDLQKDARPPRRPPPAVGRADAPTRAVPWEKDPVAIGAPARCAWPLPPTRLSVQPHSNENCTGLAQIVGLGPTLWLEIPVRALKLAHNLGQPCTIFVAARGPCHRISCPCRLTRAERSARRCRPFAALRSTGSRHRRADSQGIRRSHCDATSPGSRRWRSPLAPCRWAGQFALP
jgi:hypothetical protein